MATAAVTNTFVQLATTSAAAMNTNFTELETFENSSVVHVDGSKTMTADLDAGGFKLTGLGTPSAGTDGATKGFTDGLVEGATFDAETPYATTLNTRIVFSTATDDNDGWYDPLVYTDRLVCPEDGMYTLYIKYNTEIYTSPDLSVWVNGYKLITQTKFGEQTGSIWYCFSIIPITLTATDIIDVRPDASGVTLQTFSLSIKKVGTY
jgi:hypothetical protein